MPATLAAPMSHCFSIESLRPQKISRGGTRTDAFAREFPVLKGMALSLLNIDPRGVREPHWHPNAHELGYCIEGTGLMTIFSPGSGHDTFTIEPGTLAFVPKGYLHHIENTGLNPLRILICFSNEEPEDLDMAPGVSAMPDHILAGTVGVKKAFFEGLRKGHVVPFITQRSTPAIPPEPFMANRYKVHLEGNNPQIDVKGGTVRMTNSFVMPTLEGLAMYGVVLKPNGAREPHWHPNAAEINYLIKGTAKITLVSPNGNLDTFVMHPGDLSYMPQGYLHYIENLGQDNAEFAIFFNHTDPSDIGFSGCFGAYSNEVLASMFNISSDYFKDMPKLQQDLLVITGGG